MTIFVSCASYRDSELKNTVDSLIKNADRPQNLHIGIVQQSTKSERISFSKNSHVSEIWMPPQNAKGAGFARSEAQKMYNGEDWFLQVDSHSRFDKGWDTQFINMYEAISSATGNERIILSHFPKAYIREGNVDTYIDTFKYPDIPHRQLVRWFNRLFSGFRIPFDDPRMRLPEESEIILAGVVFAPGFIVSEVPYDPNIVFWGEELCFSIRAWTRGWQIYSPNAMPIAHFYERKGHHKIWDKRNNIKKRWDILDRDSVMRQHQIYTGELTGEWGAVDKSSLANYYDFIKQDPGQILTDYLREQNILVENQREADIFAGVVSQSLSYHCTLLSHTQCNVKGCECDCHDTQNMNKTSGKN